MTLILTGQQAYQRKQRLWRVYCRWAEQIRRAFFPDTGGVSLYMHNWYRCAEKTKPKEAKLADWIEASTYARYQRIFDKMEARDTDREHLNHGPKFRPCWCPLCPQGE